MSLKIKNDINYLLDLADTLQVEATKENIINVFDDGGYRELILTRMFGLAKMSGRHGDDGIDKVTGKQYELKTVNLIDTKGELRKRPGITTCHHMNQEVISRYRKISGLIVGIFYINDPVRIYEIPTEELEEDLSKWENRLLNEEGLSHINNPKFNFDFIVSKGKLHYQDHNYDEYFELVKKGNVIKKKKLAETAKSLENKRVNEINFKKVEEIKKEADNN